MNVGLMNVCSRAVLVALEQGHYATGGERRRKTGPTN
jgi:hypothetical protein